MSVDYMDIELNGQESSDSITGSGGNYTSDGKRIIPY